MIGIVVAAHREYGSEMVRAAEGIVGPIEAIEGVALHYGQSPEEAKALLVEAIERVDDGDGVIVFTDMFGGTPTNIALKLILEKKIEIVAGANLPMLLKAQVARREMSLNALAVFIKDYGANNIIVASEYFTKNPIRCEKP